MHTRLTHLSRQLCWIAGRDHPIRCHIMSHLLVGDGLFNDWWVHEFLTRLFLSWPQRRSNTGRHHSSKQWKLLGTFKAMGEPILPGANSVFLKLLVRNFFYKKLRLEPNQRGGKFRAGLVCNRRFLIAAREPAETNDSSFAKNWWTQVRSREIRSNENASLLSLSFLTDRQFRRLRSGGISKSDGYFDNYPITRHI